MRCVNKKQTKKKRKRNLQQLVSDRKQLRLEQERAPNPGKQFTKDKLRAANVRVIFRDAHFLRPSPELTAVSFKHSEDTSFSKKHCTHKT